MSGILDPCQGVVERINDVLAEISADQAILDDPEIPQQHKGPIRQDMRRLRRELLSLQRELQACRERSNSNLTILGVEGTQATQYFFFNGQGSAFAHDNSLTLVARKATVLRVYVNSTASSRFPVPASVTGKVVYPRIAELSPINAPIAPKSGSALNRGSFNDTLNFWIPPSDCVGLVPFTVQVFDPAHPSEIAFVSNPLTFSIHFQEVPQVRIHGVLIHYLGRGLNIPPPPSLRLFQTLSLVERMYPTSAFYYSGLEVLDFSGDLTLGGGGCGLGWGQLFNILSNMRSGSHSKDVYVGLLPSGVPTAVGGCGGGGVAIGFVGESSTLAQEIGHALNRLHAPCGNPANQDPGYPAYNSYPPGSIGEFGLDTANFLVFDPATTFDFMSYCGPTWISPHTYDGLRNGIITAAAAMHSDSPEVRRQPNEYLYLNVRVDRRGKVVLLPSFHLSGSSPPAEKGRRSAFSCELLNGEGEIVEYQECYITDPHQHEHGVYLDLHEVIPWHEAVRSINILRNGESVGAIQVSESPPTVSLLSYTQKGQIMNVAWEGGHAEYPITYMLRYSPDNGGTWQAIAADLTSTEYSVNLDLLPGGERCLCQVVASAGIRTAVAQSKPFSVPKKPLQAYILSPSPGTSFSEGEPMVIRGGGFSPDFGTVEFDDVVWTSNRDGVLGVGYEIVIRTLSVGTHKITLSFSDGLRGEATASLFIKVSPLMRGDRRPAE